MHGHPAHAHPRHLLRRAALVGAGTLLSTATLTAPASAHQVNHSGSRDVPVPAAGLASQTVVHVCPKVPAAPQQAPCTPHSTPPAEVLARTLTATWTIAGQAEGAVVHVVPTTCATGVAGTFVGVSSSGGTSAVTLLLKLTEKLGDGTSRSTTLHEGTYDDLESDGFEASGADVCFPA